MRWAKTVTVDPEPLSPTRVTTACVGQSQVPSPVGSGATPEARLVTHVPDVMSTLLCRSATLPVRRPSADASPVTVSPKTQRMRPSGSRVLDVPSPPAQSPSRWSNS